MKICCFDSDWIMLKTTLTGKKTVINIQNQSQNVIKIVNADSEKHVLMLNEVIKELNKWHHFKERICQSEKDNVERDDDLIEKLQPSSKCIHLDEEKTPHQELAVEAPNSKKIQKTKG